MIREIPPRSGTAFALDAGQTLTVIDPRGEQVADLLAFARDDVREVISSGRTFDYTNRIYLTTGDILYSNRSRPLLTIIADDLPPKILYGISIPPDEITVVLERPRSL